MQYLKADTNTEVLIGPVVAVGDGFTPVTTLSPATADEAELIKYGGASALTVTDISGSTMAAIAGADGYYTLDISTGNTDTEGFLTVLFNDDSLCLPVRHDFMVVNANVYDSLFAAATTDYLQTDSVQISGDTTAADNLKLFTEVLENGTGLIDSGTFKAGAITADTIAADTITAAKYDESTAFPVSSVMSKAGNTIVYGQVSHDNTAASTTVFYSNDVTEATADHYNGRVVIFTDGILIGQATDITDYELDTGEGKFTVTALTEAPPDNCYFVIV